MNLKNLLTTSNYEELNIISNKRVCQNEISRLVNLKKKLAITCKSLFTYVEAKNSGYLSETSAKKCTGSQG